MSTQFFPLSGAQASAAAMRTVLEDSVVHLFQSSFSPSPSNVLADYTAAEADYDGYAAITIDAWNAPILGPDSGYMIVSPLVQFATDDPDETEGNIIGGCYIVDSGGILRLTVVFTSPVPMQLPGQGIPFFLTWLFPTQ